MLFRFNFDYRLQQYQIKGNPAYNVSKGKLEFTDYLIGLGDRFGKKKLRAFGLIQGGITSYKYLSVSGPEQLYFKLHVDPEGSCSGFKSRSIVFSGFSVPPVVKKYHYND